MPSQITFSRAPIRTLAYSESWYIQKQSHIQNPGIFRALADSEHEAYSEPYQASTMEHFAKIVHGYNYICKLQLFLQYYLFSFLLYKINIMNFIKTGLIFTLEVFALCEKSMGTLIF